jgi:hypothetical protein
MGGPPGAERLLARLVADGLDPRALVPAAELALELDRPRKQDTRGGAATPTSGEPSNEKQKGATS